MSEMMWVDFVLPIVMGVVGWLGSAYRSKQKKEGDILDNVQRIIDIQDAHIKKSEEALAKSENLTKRLDMPYSLHTSYAHEPSVANVVSNLMTL